MRPYNPQVIQHMLDNKIPLTLHNYIREARQVMTTHRTPEGWVIRSACGDTHARAYTTLRKARDAMQRMNDGLIRFEPITLRRSYWND